MSVTSQTAIASAVADLSSGPRSRYRSKRELGEALGVDPSAPSGWCSVKTPRKCTPDNALSLAALRFEDLMHRGTKGSDALKSARDVLSEANASDLLQGLGIGLEEDHSLERGLRERASQLRSRIPEGHRKLQCLVEAEQAADNMRMLGFDRDEATMRRAVANFLTQADGEARKRDFVETSPVLKVFFFQRMAVTTGENFDPFETYIKAIAGARRGRPTFFVGGFTGDLPQREGPVVLRERLKNWASDEGVSDKIHFDFCSRPSKSESTHLGDLWVYARPKNALGLLVAMDADMFEELRAANKYASTKVESLLLYRLSAQTVPLGGMLLRSLVSGQYGLQDGGEESVFDFEPKGWTPIP